ncbi:MAG: choice-of-anchor B family protein [Bacteroidetes bacterium]|nr:choice-of-anchor B family protein [Bacteroidota bacterium]
MNRFFTLCLFASLTVSVAMADSPRLAGEFGRAIAVGDGHLFISSSGGFHNTPMVHVYVQGEDHRWILKNSLSGPDSGAPDFGKALAYDRGILAVVGQSMVYIYEQETENGDFVLSDQVEAGDASTFGSALSLEYGWLAVSALDADDIGQVHLLKQNSEGDWIKTAVLKGPEETDSSMYGYAFSMDQGRLLIGSPEACAAYLYESQGDEWGLSATLSCGELSAESKYGMAVDLSGDLAVIGAPQSNSYQGAAVVWRWENHEDAGWKEFKILSPENSSFQLFGLHVQIKDSQQILVGVPNFPGRNSEVEGAVRIYSLMENEDADSYASLEGITFAVGSTIAIDGKMMVVGSPAAAYGEGIAALLQSNGSTWDVTQELFHVGYQMPGEADVVCEGGQAAGFDCGLVDLVSFLPNEQMEMNRGVRLSDVWGWTDSQTGIEYGLIGHMEGTVFVDLSNPSMPKYLGTLPRTKGSPGSTWRDVKVYKDHAFIVADGAQEHGMQIFDLRQLRSLDSLPVEFEATAHYDLIHSAHNIVINEETGFAFAVGASAGGETCGGGLHMIDIREPQAPSFAGCFADASTGRRQTGYSHDAQCVIYNGPDSEFSGREICFGANETAISISDVTDKENPVAIGTGSYPDAAYVHQGWLSEDHAYFFQNDEHDELTGKVDKTRTLVWDVSDLSDPIMIRQFFGPTSATDHNLYVQGDLMYQTNNASGLRIIDVSTPENPVEIAHFDTTPYGTDEAGFNGTWSSYPYFGSGIIVVTSRREGLFILRKQPIDI